MLTTEVVTKRALCIGLMALRAQAENGISYIEGRSEQFRKFGEDLMAWADTYGVANSLSENERELYAVPLGEWEYGDIFETFWRVEALKAVLWALGHLPEMPTYFEVGNPNAIYSLIPSNKPTQDFIDRSQLRPEAIVEQQKQTVKFLNWRARTEMFRLQGMAPPPGDSYGAVVRRALEGLADEGVEVDHDGVDILVNGQRYIDLDDEVKSNVASICIERQLALEWICSDDEDWDSAHCDT